MKGNLFQGAGFGKLGDVVFYRMDGQQMARQRIRRIKNPRSAAQAAQRALINTLSAAYSAMQGIVNHSFQGLGSVGLNQREFYKRNQAVARATGSVTPAGTDSGWNFNFKGENLLRPNTYVMSRGSAPELPMFWQNSTASFHFETPVDFTGSYDEVINALGLQRGDQLTFCWLTPLNNSFSAGIFRFARVILEPANGDFATQFYDYVQESVISPNSRNQGDLSSVFGSDDLLSSAHNQILWDQNALCACCIVSRYSGSQWLRSNATMAMWPEAIDSNTMSEVFNSYMEADAEPVSDLYLNGSGNVVPDGQDPTQGSAVSVGSVTKGGSPLSANIAGEYVVGDGGTVQVTFNIDPYRELPITISPNVAGANILSNPTGKARTLTATLPAPAAGGTGRYNVSCGDKHVILVTESSENG